MRIARKTESASYIWLGRLFVLQFFLFRVVGGQVYFAKLLHVTLAQERPIWWAWAGESCLWRPQ